MKISSTMSSVNASSGTTLTWVDSVFPGKAERGLDGGGVGSHEHERDNGMQLFSGGGLARHEVGDFRQHFGKRKAAAPDAAIDIRIHAVDGEVDLLKARCAQHVEDVFIEAGRVRVDPESGVHGNDPREGAGISAFIDEDVATVVGGEVDELFAARYVLHRVPNPIRGEPQLLASRPRNAVGAVEIALADWAKEERSRQRLIRLRLGVNELRFKQERTGRGLLPHPVFQKGGTQKEVLEQPGRLESDEDKLQA